jgi:hypothetical protein
MLYAGHGDWSNAISDRSTPTRPHEHSPPCNALLTQRIKQRSNFSLQRSQLQLWLSILLMPRWTQYNYNTIKVSNINFVIYLSLVIISYLTSSWHDKFDNFRMKSLIRSKKTLYNISLTGPQKHRNQSRSQSQNVVDHYDGRHTKLLGRSLTCTDERA